MRSSEQLNSAIREVVDNQLRDDNPPETKETLERLVASGIAPDEARRLIACVVAGEIFETLSKMQPYDHERYVSALRRLPELPE